MKVLIAGKGGVGKTTISALTAHLLADKGYNVIALDTDSIPNLALNLGIPYEKAKEIIPLSKNEHLIEERTGAKPGNSWGSLFSLTPKVNDIVEKYGITVKPNLKLVIVGSIDQSNEGCLCPAIALAKAFLKHLLTSSKEVVIVDSEAGAEVFGRGLAQNFDALICVSEPTLKSLTISKKLIEMGRELGIKKLHLAINKVKDQQKALSIKNKVFLETYSIPTNLIIFDENIIKAENEGKGVQSIPDNSPALTDVKNLIQSIIL